MPTILVTGFGPFPGAPSNPTMRIARRLCGLRRTRYANVQRILRILPTTWAMLNGIEAEITTLKPDAVLMFGLAGRRRAITPEARARNRSSILRTDAERGLPSSSMLAIGGPLSRHGGIDASRMVATLRHAGLPAAVSRDAGDYLCNALFWHVAGTGVPCIFIHVPRPIRPTTPKGRLKRRRPKMRQLEHGAELCLDVLLRKISRFFHGQFP